MTERLYYDSAELTFTGQVIGHDGDATRAILDRTAFYPTSGGQPHDTGTLAGIAVVDVIDQGDQIVHVLAAPLRLGSVHGAVDARRRQDYTIQHTAQHLVSALAEDRLGWRTESVHFGPQHCTVEFDATEASPDQLGELEAAANQAIRSAVPVRVSYESAETVGALRKPVERRGLIRIVTIVGFDRSACGGTHLTTTAEIGSLLLTGVERIRGRIRVGYLAGDRVLAHCREADAELTRLSELTGASRADLAAVVAARLTALGEAERRLGIAERELAGHTVAGLVAAVQPEPTGWRRLVLHPGDQPMATLRQWAAAAVAIPGTLFIATCADPASLIVAAAADTGVDAAAWLAGALDPLGGRGGGSPRVAQGRLADGAALDQAVAQLSRH